MDMDRNEQLGLGRRPESDDRDQGFRMAAVMPYTEMLAGRMFWWDNGNWNDQNGYATCVGFNTVNWIEDSPVTHPKEAFDPFELYRECCLADEWVDNDGGDLYFGSSIHAAAKVLTARGLLGEYRWAFTLEEVVNWLLTRGPLLVGTTFWASMYDCEMREVAPGYDRMVMPVDESSTMLGGHCYLWNGVNTNLGTIRVKMGSWDRGLWGVDGRASLTFDDAEKLISDSGEIMAGIEIRR